MRTHPMRSASAALLAALLAACGGGDGGDGGVTTPPASGTVSGAVTADGAGVASATVALGSATQTTNAAGQFTFANVATGSQTLTLTLPSGFELGAGEAASKSVTVAAGQTATVNWTARRGQLPRQAAISLESRSFSPADVSVAVGGTVTWTNATATAHTITPNNAAQAGVWADQNISGQGTTFQHTFNTAGDFNYNCRFHSGMTGVVHVQ